MAFSGMPSKACANCRLRRIKCNLAEPECAQCRRAGKECPGYRDQLTLLFRNENEKVIRKVCGRPALIEKQKNKAVEKGLQDAEFVETKLSFSQLSNHIPASTSSALPIWSNTSNPSMSMPRSVSPYIQDPGINFFFHHYMTGASLVSCGQPNIFSSYIWQGVSQTRHFIDAISCVGLAGLSNVNNDQEMMAVARQKYAITLQRVMAALKVPGIADMGYTLKAVMMLALFEMINCDMPTAGLWMVHLDGIAALLSSEQFQQVQFRFGTRVKHQFFFAMFIKYTQSGQKYPASMVKLARIWAKSLCKIDSPVAYLTDIVLRFLDLNADVRQGTVVDPNHVFQEALTLGNALETWKVNLPPIWKYEVVKSSETLGTYDGQYHIYSDHWIARMWDHYRWICILVHELILSQLSLLLLTPPEIYEQKTKSLRMISQVASGICAGVSSQLFRPNNGISSTPSKSQITSVFMLLWPLKIAGGAIGVSESLHEWTLDTLEKIGQTMGIRQTRIVIFSTVVQRELWKSESLSGSGNIAYSL